MVYLVRDNWRLGGTRGQRDAGTAGGWEGLMTSVTQGQLEAGEGLMTSVTQGQLEAGRDSWFI